MASASGPSGFQSSSRFWARRNRAERSKNGLAHRVPLSPQALRILKNLRGVAGDSPSVFPSARKKGSSIKHAQKAIEPIVERSGIDFRGHDLRRTAASLMVGAGVPRLVVSKILNHVETGVTAVYDRHSYDLEKRAALNSWGKRLETIVRKRAGGGPGQFALLTRGRSPSAESRDSAKTSRCTEGV